MKDIFVLRNLFLLCSLLCCYMQLPSPAVATNYCDPALCDGKPHIGCNNNGAFGPLCGKARVMKLNATDRQGILKIHNRFRNRVALGRLKGFKPSARMATMSWDDELAYLAVLNVKRCKMEHDKCRKTDRFPKAGQNLSRTKMGGKDRTVMTIVLEQITQWFDENIYCTMADVYNLQDTPRFHKFGHFSAMITGKNSRVGCGVVRDTRNGETTQYLACNYARANILKRAIYLKGTAANKCDSGPNKLYKGLCSRRERFNYSVARSLNITKTN